jgi:hypothetical protein
MQGRGCLVHNWRGYDIITKNPLSIYAPTDFLKLNYREEDPPRRNSSNEDSKLENSHTSHFRGQKCKRVFIQSTSYCFPISIQIKEQNKLLRSPRRRWIILFTVYLTTLFSDSNYIASNEGAMSE